MTPVGVESLIWNNTLDPFQDPITTKFRSGTDPRDFLPDDLSGSYSGFAVAYDCSTCDNETALGQLELINKLDEVEADKKPSSHAPTIWEHLCKHWQEDGFTFVQYGSDRHKRLLESAYDKFKVKLNKARILNARKEGEEEELDEKSVPLHGVPVYTPDGWYKISWEADGTINSCVPYKLNAEEEKRSKQRTGDEWIDKINPMGEMEKVPSGAVDEGDVEVLLTPNEYNVSANESWIQMPDGYAPAENMHPIVITDDDGNKYFTVNIQEVDPQEKTHFYMPMSFYGAADDHTTMMETKLDGRLADFLSEPERGNLKMSNTSEEHWVEQFTELLTKSIRVIGSGDSTVRVRRKSNDYEWDSGVETVKITTKTDTDAAQELSALSSGLGNSDYFDIDISSTLFEGRTSEDQIKEQVYCIRVAGTSQSEEMTDKIKRFFGV